MDEGDAVKKGQVIARLDRDQLVAQQEREQAALASAESQLAQAETSLDWEKATLAADMEQKQADLASNQARLLELKNGSRPQENPGIQRGGGGGAVGARPRQDAIGIAPRRCIRTTTFPPSSTISIATAGKAPRRPSSRPRSAMRWCRPGPRVEVMDAAAGQVEHARGALKMAEANALEMKRREQELTTRRAEIDARQGQPRADRFAARRYRGALAGGWRGAGEIGRSGRGAGRGNHGGDRGRYRPSLAARLRQ